MTAQAYPAHSGAAIAFGMITPREETPVIVTAVGLQIDGVIGGAHNDSGSHGWFGPRPPPGHGGHRYYFQLFAVDGPLTLSPESDRRTPVDAL
jgi:phosphatidylethanolamine-binding protein (PEBP) family uncharacterized protein